RTCLSRLVPVIAEGVHETVHGQTTRPGKSLQSTQITADGAMDLDAVGHDRASASLLVKQRSTKLFRSQPAATLHPCLGFPQLLIVRPPGRYVENCQEAGDLGPDLEESVFGCVQRG